MIRFTIILILLIGSCNLLTAQELDFNSPVSKFGNMTCTVITPLSVTPTWHGDFLNWPTVPVGSKYIIGSNGDQDADFRSIFTYTGEASYDFEISIDRETLKNNVEISYTLRGTAQPSLGAPLSSIPVLDFNNNKQIVTLSTQGKYYLHIIYNWVWAHEGADTGVIIFLQNFYALYHNL